MTTSSIQGTNPYKKPAAPFHSSQPVASQPAASLVIAVTRGFCDLATLSSASCASHFCSSKLQHGKHRPTSIVQLWENAKVAKAHANTKWHLPIELTERTLEYFDIKSLLDMQRVSRSWNALLKNLGHSTVIASAWERAYEARFLFSEYSDDNTKSNQNNWAYNRYHKLHASPALLLLDPDTLPFESNSNLPPSLWNERCKIDSKRHIQLAQLEADYYSADDVLHAESALQLQLHFVHSKICGLMQSCTKLATSSEDTLQAQSAQMRFIKPWSLIKKALKQKPDPSSTVFLVFQKLAKLPRKNPLSKILSLTTTFLEFACSDDHAITADLPIIIWTDRDSDIAPKQRSVLERQEAFYLWLKQLSAFSGNQIDRNNLYNLGLTHLCLKQYDAALRAFNECLSGDNNSLSLAPPAEQQPFWDAIAYAYLRQGNEMPFWNILSAHRPTPPHSNYFTLLGMMDRKAGRLIECMNHYVHALNASDINNDLSMRETLSGNLAYVVGKLEMSMGDDYDKGLYQEITSLAQKYLSPVETTRFSFKKHKVLAYAGASHRALGNYEQAVSYLSQALTLPNIEGDKAFILAHLGDVERHLERMDDAINHLRESLQCNPKDCIALAFLGLALHRKGHLEEAHASLQEARKRLQKGEPGPHNAIITKRTLQEVEDALMHNER